MTRPQSSTSAPWILAAPLAKDVERIADTIIAGRPVEAADATALYAAAGLLRSAEAARREGRLQ